MRASVVLCTDGSELSVKAIRDGMAVLAPDVDLVLVTAVEPTDATLVTGSGLAGGVMTEDELVAQDEATRSRATAALAEVARELGLDSVRMVVLEGATGPAICSFAEAEEARAIVIGTRGRGGLKRAVLGSVSDYVVRNAPCVVVVRPASSASA